METKRVTELSGEFPLKIGDFIKSHHVANITAVSDQTPWTFHAFFAFVESEPGILFLSEKGSRHYGMMTDNPVVSGGIAVETEQIGKIMGVQFSGQVSLCNPATKYRMRYLKRFPYAVFNDADLWILRFHEVKFTDNMLLFGKKIIWKKNISQS